MADRPAQLAGRVALVTGASSGVGRAIALGLADRGATVCLTGRSRRRLEAAAEEARAGNGTTYVYVADLSTDRDIRVLHQSLAQQHVQLDILVHSAGEFVMGPIAATGPAALDKQYGTNLRAPYVLTQMVLPMLRAPGGQIVFLNSSVGLRAKEGVAAYAATKHGLRALADSLRDEVNPHGIRVLSVYLGRTATPMQSGIHEVEGKPYRPERLLQPKDVADIVVAAISLPGTAEVTEIRIRPAMKPAS